LTVYLNQVGLMNTKRLN